MESVHEEAVGVADVAVGGAKLRDKWETKGIGI